MQKNSVLFFTTFTVKYICYITFTSVFLEQIHSNFMTNKIYAEQIKLAKRRFYQFLHRANILEVNLTINSQFFDKFIKS